jgi:hypothetical protein
MINIYIGMKKTLSSCNECGENKSILTQVSCTVEVIYLCSDCYKDKYSEEVREEIEKDDRTKKKF